jgi:RES domain-containing protein
VGVYGSKEVPVIDELNLAELKIEEKWKPLRGVWYRCHKATWMTDERVLSGDGAFREGGRWMPAGCYHAVYLSIDPVVATAEWWGNLQRRFGDAVDSAAFPALTRPVEVRLSKVIDMRDQGMVELLGLSEEDLFEEVEWSSMKGMPKPRKSQQVGKALAELGTEGLLVRSAAKKRDSNLVIFKERLGSGSQVQVTGGSFPENLRV